MKQIILVSIIISLLIACTSKEERANDSPAKTDSTAFKIPFDKTKWRIKEGEHYPYRLRMLDSLTRKENLKALKKLRGKEVFELFGAPDRIDGLHLFYQISKQQIGFVPFQIKTMVIKLDKDSTLQWVKIHN
jgi:hypothetical protein